MSENIPKVHSNSVLRSENRSVYDNTSVYDNMSVYSGMSFNPMSRDVSKGTWDTWHHTQNLWSIMNAIPDDKIEKFEWDFVIKSVGKHETVLSQDKADFLFAYLDKDNDGSISKPELKAKLNLVVRLHKWDENNTPTKTEMIQCTYDYAFKDMKENNPIDFKLQMAMITVKNLLTKLLHQIRTARKHYEAVHEAIIDTSQALFSDPQKIYDKHLKEHEGILSQYASGNLQRRYNDVKELLNAVLEEYNFVNAQTTEFIEKGRELCKLKERDERCCKVFGCLCPCVF